MQKNQEMPMNNGDWPIYFVKNGDQVLCRGENAGLIWKDASSVTAWGTSVFIARGRTPAKLRACLRNGAGQDDTALRNQVVGAELCRVPPRTGWVEAVRQIGTDWVLGSRAKTAPWVA